MLPCCTCFRAESTVNGSWRRPLRVVSGLVWCRCARDHRRTAEGPKGRRRPKDRRRATPRPKEGQRTEVPLEIKCRRGRRTGAARAEGGPKDRRRARRGRRTGAAPRTPGPKEAEGQAPREAEGPKDRGPKDRRRAERPKDRRRAESRRTGAVPRTLKVRTEKERREGL